MNRRLFFFFLFLLGSVCSFPLQAQFYSVRSEKVNLIYYDHGHAYVVPHVMRSFGNAMKFHSNLFGYSLSEEITVILEDLSDYGNAGASSVPRNIVMIGLSPFHFAFETNPMHERMTNIMNHELIHVVALDMASPSDRFFRSLFFGKVNPSKEDPISMMYGYLTTPRRYAPRWYHEGIAEFVGTWMAGGIGRGQGTYDEMVFRTMVRDGSRIYDAIGLESEGTTVDFQVGANSYLYGTRFMSYLALRYEPAKLIDWVARTNESRRYYSGQFRRVFGSPLDDEWSSWIAWEREWQRENLERIRRNPVTSFRQLSRRPLGAVSRAFYDEKRNEIYAAISYPGQVAHIAAINPENGSIRHICDINGSALYFVTSIAYDRATGTIFYATNNSGWRDLYAVQVDSRRSELLMKESRTGDLAFNPVDRSLWGVRHHNGISSIVRIPYPYEEWNTVRIMPYVEVVFDIDISPDGKFLTAAVFDVSGNNKLIMMETEALLRGEFTYQTIFNFEENTPANFTFSGDGRSLYGSTYYSGVSNIVRYDFEDKQLEWLTNAETGYFRPIPVSEDSLIAFRYTGEGFVPVMLANERQEQISSIRFLGNEVIAQHSMLREWQLLPTADDRSGADTVMQVPEPYSPGNHIRLTSAYPIVRGYKSHVNAGVKFDFKDPILFNEIDVTVSYTPNNRLPESERFHATLMYSYWQQWKFTATYNDDSFYDLFGPTKTSRKGYSVGLSYRGSIIYNVPQIMNYDISAFYYGGMERLPEFQEIAARIPDFFILHSRLNYQYFHHSLGAVDNEKGYRWQAISYINYASGNVYPRVLTNFDYGVALPLRHSSVWFRSSAGYSFGDREEPLANFYFGGFGNNWVDYLSARRYREFYSFPGAELNAIGGSNYAKLLVELVLPPVRFRRMGIVSFYSNWSQLTFFSSGIITNLDHVDFRRKVANVGTQLDFKLVIFSVLESTLSFGYAMAFENRMPTTDEFMISLKILR
jgi:hypothetical protein